MADESTRYVTWEIHNEFEKRLDAENKRQDARIGELEATVKQISELVASVKVLAVNMENMTTEQKRTSERLSDLEKQPAKHWEAVVAGIIAAIVGALGTAIASGVIH